MDEREVEAQVGVAQLNERFGPAARPVDTLAGQVLQLKCEVVKLITRWALFQRLRKKVAPCPEGLAGSERSCRSGAGRR
jgi:hypothetical protein